MRSIFAFALITLAFLSTYGQNEQAPIVEKEITYQDWVFVNVKTGRDLNLRKVTFSNKLVIVVYWAPWCPNWKHDAPMLQRFYEKYHDRGMEIVGVGEYDTVDAMKAGLDALKITFPVVYESTSREDREKTNHFAYRKATGDTRKWGSPWYILLATPELIPTGNVLTKKTFVINGEMIETEGEKFIRQKLGLPPEESKLTSINKDVTEVCDPAKPTELKKPVEKP